MCVLLRCINGEVKSDVGWECQASVKGGVEPGRFTGNKTGTGSAVNKCRKVLVLVLVLASRQAAGAVGQSCRWAAAARQCVMERRQEA